VNEWIVTAASAGVVAFMVAVAALLGFRQTTRLDDAAIQRLAANEGDHSEAAIIAPNGRAAVARLRSGKLMVARAMGADVSVRIAATSALRVRLRRNNLSVAFADVGYPPLNMTLTDAPPWIAALAAGDAP
jgi:hypothetical protein